MDRKNLIVIVVILTGGILLGKFGERFFSNSNSLNTCKSILKAGSKVNSQNYNAPQNLLNLQNSFTQVVKKIKPALVNISAVRVIEVQTPFHQFYFGDPFEEFFDDFFGRPRRKKTPKPEMEEFRYEGTGSGFIVHQDGYILTNYHVIKDAEEIKVTMHDDKKYNAKIIGRDPVTDLAVVKIKSSEKFNALHMSDSSLVEVGSWVMAAGSPFGLQQTYTTGIISAVRQDVQVEKRAYRNMLQTDAAINRGNSGGPLVDLGGRVIGINTAIFAPTGVFTGIGFAIPINQAKKVLDQLIEKGKVVRGWLGVAVMDADEAIRDQYGLKGAGGVLVNKVIKDSGAYKGGIKRGDIIVSVEGNTINAAGDLQDKISAYVPGKKVKVKIIRDTHEKIIEIELSERPDNTTVSVVDKKSKDPEVKNITCKGIKVINIDAVLKEYHDLSDTDGVIVAEIDSSKECYDIGLHVGDVIKEINRKKIKNVSDFQKEYGKVTLKKGVVFDVIRNGLPVYLTYKKSE